MNKYIFYSEATGVSDSFNTLEECETTAEYVSMELNCECSIYSYDASKFPNEDFDIDDCTYIGYFEKK